MTARRGYLLVIAAWVIAALVGWRAQAAQAPPVPRLVKGETYVVLYSCVAQVGCYGEILTVMDIEKNWVRFRDAQNNDVWDVNLDSVIAVQPYQAPAVRAAN